MSLPPLANVFAIKSADPRLLAEVESRVRATKDNCVVRRPRPSWLVTMEGVPPTDLPMEQDASIFFTEGGGLFDEAEIVRVAEAAAAGSASLSRHEGDFGFLHIRSDEEATLVRSCGGWVPAYIRRDSSYVAVGTLLTDLIRFTPGEVMVDPFPFAIWGALGQTVFPNNRTFFKDITVVPRAHILTIGPDGRTSAQRYWDPRPRSVQEPTEDRRREHIERCRGVLLDTLARELDPRGHNLLTLSGGVDSSALAALAAGVLGYPVSTLSLLPTKEPHLSNDMAYIDSLRNTYRFERTWEFPLDYMGRIDAARSAPKVAFPVLHPALGLLPRVAAEQEVHVLFGGEFADEVCGSRFTFPDWLRHTTAGALLKYRAKWPQGLRTLPRWIKHRTLRLAGRPYLPLDGDLPEFVQPEIREEYRQWRADQRRALAGDDRALPYLSFEAEKDGFIAMNWEAASAVGMRRIWPFFSRAMLELAFDCHPSELVGPDTKRLLRAALEGLVPPMNLHRPDRGHWRPTPGAEPPPPPLLGLEGVFDLERLEKEQEIARSTSWVFRRLLDSLQELRNPPLYPGGEGA